MLFAQETGSGQIVGWTALVATVLTGLLTLIGSYLTNRQAARAKAADRDNDDKWKIITQLQTELQEVKKDFADYRDVSQTRYDHARQSERVGFLEAIMEANDLRVPRRRPEGMTDSEMHRTLPDLNKKKDGGT
jgi:hypothetical protein